jgi:hypothetical protein
MEEEFLHLFPGFLAYAVAVHHCVTQVSITHMGCIFFDDERLHSVPTILVKLPSAGGICILERT